MSPDSFDALAATLNEPALLVEGGGKVVAANRPASAASGVPRERLLGASLLELTEDPAATRALLRSAAGSRSLRPGRLVFRTADGPRSMRVEAGVVRPWGSEPALLFVRGRPAGDRNPFAILSDKVDALSEEIRRRIHLEEERTRLLEEARSATDRAVAASQVRDQFLATVTHELRTPLNAILTWVELLKGHDLSPERDAQGLGAIERAARSQATVINDLLDLSSMLAGRVRMGSTSVDLKEVVEGVVATLQPAAEEREVTLIAILDERTPAVLGDAHRLGQVVGNLLTNAVKFSERGDTVWVRLRGSQGSAVLEVEDEGIGISADFLPFAFERFRQAQESQPEGGGMGLGLTIVRQLVELHGGTVIAESAGMGHGATFTVTLPAEPEGGDGTSAENPPDQRPRPAR